jgi:hypothetical protein
MTCWKTGLTRLAKTSVMGGRGTPGCGVQMT